MMYAGSKNNLVKESEITKVSLSSSLCSDL